MQFGRQVLIMPHLLVTFLVYPEGGSSMFSEMFVPKLHSLTIENTVTFIVSSIRIPDLTETECEFYKVGTEARGLIYQQPPPLPLAAVFLLPPKYVSLTLLR
jgi:hypothetical protein